MQVLRKHFSPPNLHLLTLIGKSNKSEQMQVWRDKYVWGFYVLASLLIKLQPEKGTVVLLSVGMFGGSMSSDSFGGILDRITTGKNGQQSGHRLLCLGGSMNLGFFGGFVTMFFGGSLIKLQITTGKKRYSRLAIGWNVYYVLLTHFEWGSFLRQAHC